MFLFNIVKKNDDDDNVSPFEMLKVFNKLLFRGASCRKIVCCSGWSILGVYSTTQLKYIIPYILKFVYGAAIVTGGVTISVWVISSFIYKKEDEDIVIVESENDKYINFINKDYDLFIDIFKNNTEYYFTNKNEKYIEDLKNVENHESYELPYSYNPKMIFYYDFKHEEFHYYCNSDVSSKILNSACRTYTITKKCINLFNDEEEIVYMKKEAQGIIDVSFSNVEVEENDEDSDAEKSISCNSMTSSEEKEESGGFVNIFYNKKNKNKDSLSKNKEEELKTNKYIYKGNIEEYNSIFLKKKDDPKNTSYEDYLKQCKK
tara:strand:- start:836 stop:1789 length:954 start_codon:yes stop_codon:yes gene_type:complete